LRYAELKPPGRRWRKVGVVLELMAVLVASGVTLVLVALAWSIIRKPLKAATLHATKWVHFRLDWGDEQPAELDGPVKESAGRGGARRR
jgi:heme/copper-type cytochrome/quinol oxidase subunit 1